MLAAVQVKFVTTQIHFIGICFISASVFLNYIFNKVFHSTSWDFAHLWVGLSLLSPYISNKPQRSNRDHEILKSESFCLLQLI